MARSIPEGNGERESGVMQFALKGRRRSQPCVEERGSCSGYRCCSK